MISLLEGARSRDTGGEASRSCKGKEQFSRSLQKKCYTGKLSSEILKIHSDSRLTDLQDIKVLNFQ